MLRLEILDERGQPIVIDCARVVVRERNTNTPIAAAADFAERGVMVGVVTDPDFQQLLAKLRVNDTVVVTKLDARQLLSPQVF